MKLKKILLLSGALFCFFGVFIISAVSKNIDVEWKTLLHIRTAMVILAFFCTYFYVELQKQELKISLVDRIGRVALIAGIFLGIYVVIRFLPLAGFELREFRIFPLDYLTIFFSSFLTICAGILAIVSLLFLKDMLLYKRKKGTLRNFWILLSIFLATSISTVNIRPLESSLITRILFVVSIVLIIMNSFRLSWIAYLSRRDKIYALLYSLLAFFGFIIINIVLSESSTVEVEQSFFFNSLRYYSYPLFIFVQLIAIFGSVYFGMAFISTLFHLPTAEAFDRKQTEISSLHNLSRLINQVFDLRELADTATKMTSEACEATSVWLEIIPTDESRQQSKVISRKNILEEEISDIVSGGEHSVRAAVLFSKKVLLVDDVASDRRTKHIPKTKKAGSLLIVPLLSHEKVIGILYATKEMAYGFDQDDADVLSGFADQVAIAIENARLIEKSFEKERLQRELMLAQEMQKRLLPQSLPNHPAVVMCAVSSPALEVGGDYYDVIQLDKNRFGIVIGDVSGKGVGAAFYMAEVKGIFQSLSKIYSSPKEFLIRANETLFSSIDKRSFISLIYSVLDTATGELTLARAGHCPMMYVSASGSEYVKPNGLGLGLNDGAIFNSTIEERKIQLHRDDVCVLYTDGVTESRSADGEEFGYERLMSVVEQCKHTTCDEIKETIIQNVWNYTDAHGYDDDLTIIVIKWRGL